MPRTKGSKNGISTTPGYTAIGNVAKVINGVYESQLKQNPNNSNGSYNDWQGRMMASQANAMRGVSGKANPYYHKPSFNLLNTPEAVQRYSQWQKQMEGQNTAATQSAAQQLRKFANSQAVKNHNVTNGYSGNPTAQIQAQKHAQNASYYEPAKMTNATYDVSKTKTRTTQGTHDDSGAKYVDPVDAALKGVKFKGDAKEVDRQKELYKKLLNNPNYTGDLITDDMRERYEAQVNANTENARRYGANSMNTMNSQGDYQAQLARENERKRNAAKEKAINDAFAQISRQKRADAIRRKKAVIDDPDRGSRGTLANVIRDLKDDAKRIANNIRKRKRRYSI